MEVTSAELKDGMLHVHVVRIVPEDKKPKSIKIK
jgi:HSP20 family molecular chaperone IbpA